MAGLGQRRLNSSLRRVETHLAASLRFFLLHCWMRGCRTPCTIAWNSWCTCVLEWDRRVTVRSVVRWTYGTVYTKGNAVRTYLIAGIARLEIFISVDLTS